MCHVVTYRHQANHHATDSYVKCDQEVSLLQKVFLGAAGNPLQGRFGQPPLPNRLYKSCICRGGSQAVPTNRFVGAAVVPVTSIIPVCIPAKKIQIYNSNSTRIVCFHVFHSAFALPNAPRPTFRTAFALPNAPRPAFRTHQTTSTRVLYKL